MAGESVRADLGFDIMLSAAQEAIPPATAIWVRLNASFCVRAQRLEHTLCAWREKGGHRSGSALGGAFNEFSGCLQIVAVEFPRQMKGHE